MMQWQRLLYPQRLGKIVSEDISLARTPFQRDFDRLIFSAAFRRLKDKTQVFSLSQNDYVRTRLIHSLEVASVGRSLGRVVGEQIVTNLEYATAADVGDIVAAACIAHDIGNPPFGHSGENAIRAGFRAWQNRQSGLGLTPAQQADLDRFEGNAQGFRMIARLEIPHRPGSLQLTCPTIAAFAKYPRESLLPEEKSPNARKRKTAEVREMEFESTKEKYGFFQADRELFISVAESVGLIPLSGKGLAWCRHPLTYLVEAADDICYSVVDIEDGYQMGYLSFGEVAELLNPIAQLDLVAELGAAAEQVIHLRAKAIDLLVREAATNFLQREQEILRGEFQGDLLALSQYQEALETIHTKARQTIFQHPHVVGVQVAGYEVLGKLFNEFADALRQPNNPKSQLVLQMLPNHLPGDDSYHQLLQVTDFISGMTDSYATRLFQQFSGISLL
jgi:dGTPase